MKNKNNTMALAAIGLAGLIAAASLWKSGLGRAEAAPAQTVLSAEDKALAEKPQKILSVDSARVSENA